MQNRAAVLDSKEYLVSIDFANHGSVMNVADLMFRPRPKTLPSGLMMALPTGMPPSARPAFASSNAIRAPSSLIDMVVEQT
jgi:hypothetical protein